MHDKIIDLYERNAAAWAEMRGTRLQEKAWLDRFTAPIPAGGAILDLGCGHGEAIGEWRASRFITAALRPTRIAPHSMLTDSKS